MNFLHAAPSWDAEGWRDGAATNHVVLIPSYNTGARLARTVAAIRVLGWPVWVVIDGSTDGSGDELARNAAPDPGVRLFVLPTNLGKGAAILRGLREAHAAGITHVVTIDADGQHAAEDIAAFVALSRARPEAMVLGVPVFDDSAPRIRVRGHAVADFWANLVAPRAGIGSSLFGFRVCPVVPLLRAFDETRWMRRFDFDSEAVIRMAWHGVPAINRPTPVRYFTREDGGVSHFRYLRDNLLLVSMYHRLIGESLVRSLARRLRSLRRRTETFRDCDTGRPMK